MLPLFYAKYKENGSLIKELGEKLWLSLGA